MKNKSVLLLAVVTTSCTTIKTPSGYSVNQFGGSMSLEEAGGSYITIDNERSFSDGASAIKHGVWGAVVSGGLGNAASVLNTRSANGATKAITNSNNGAAVATNASNNATNQAINASNNATREVINASDNALEAALNSVEMAP